MSIIESHFNALEKGVAGKVDEALAGDLSVESNIGQWVWSDAGVSSDSVLSDTIKSRASFVSTPQISILLNWFDSKMSVKRNCLICVYFSLVFILMFISAFHFYRIQSTIFQMSSTLWIPNLLQNKHSLEYSQRSNKKSFHSSPFSIFRLFESYLLANGS